MLQRFTEREMAVNRNSAMEFRNHSKNGANPKSLRSRRNRFLVAAITLAVVFAACTRDDVIDGGKMQKTTLQGIVRDVSGYPLSGVRVVTGSVSATTNDEGTFSFSQAEVVKHRAVIKFEKSGYYTLTRSKVEENDMFIEAVLYPQGNSNISLQTSFEASSAKILEIGGMKVDLPASSIMRSDGSTYTGTVNADMLYLDPNNENFAGMMPGGDLAAIRTDNSEVMLISWGMTNVNLTDNAGKPLQIKNGSAAELTFPIPAGMENNPPATIPLWHFDEDKGIWIESGVATRQGNVYVGTVTHFSWVNLDVPVRLVTINGKVVDCNGEPVPYSSVKNGQTYIMTNNKGNYSGYVPENTQITLTITYFGKTYSKDIPGKQGGTTYNVEDFQLPCFTPDIDRTYFEKVTIEHVYRRIPNDMGNSEAIFYTTFDNYGKIIRRDLLQINNDRDPYGSEGIFVASHQTKIINHINGTYYEWEIQWLNQDWYWSDDKDLGYDEGKIRILSFGSVYSPLCIVNETGLVAEGFTRLADKVIGDRNCRVYSKVPYTYAIWNGLALLIEDKFTDYTEIWECKRITFDVPEEVFIPQQLCWPPKDRLPENWFRMWSYCW